ncbi:formylglycine-generating enzyme family protein [Alsobacter sp. SYSU M60028]|uniref:Formylglycine-generating enzyme family protein n=1 Tax=Alsobacter ponti TaxID=2962936 RepID=A0ABT1LCE0_9HYPH|nr:formylglycine-generating enzyme family protein [Alsobacter ponti]
MSLRVPVPGGRALVGTDRPFLPVDGEGPQRSVRLAGFQMDAHAVTNARFGRYVEATGYVTEAERFGWSFVFHAFLRDRSLGPVGAAAAPWWRRVEGACWRHPEGPDSTLDGRAEHPVVHVSWRDAAAFASWAGGRLPGEAEWEHAARGGLGDVAFPWGDRAPDDETFQPCNIWQGAFPHTDLGRDGWRGTCPVDAFESNGYGLFNMAGNVWEWCADPFRVRSLKRDAAARNATADAQGWRLMKGGSYLCHASYCFRYRIAARLGVPPDSTTGHVGFRLAYDA